MDVDTLLEQDNWHEERNAFRALILEHGLDETVKWGKLCYSWKGANVVIIYGMKDYCALGFFKGALLDDPSGHLVAPGENSQAMRQLRFRSLHEIDEGAALITGFLRRALKAEQDGLEVVFDAKHDLTYPEELQAALDADAGLARAFQALTPGRKRGYVLHVSQAKQAATRRSRIEKSRAKIMAGKGLADR
ncbi:YdeI/OmpD-associated family protein [Oceaniglobus trochenteri]|uniref:YdeI/OmpD-associated family protein n=1 Tax=Oceaniglobus trochenteri TaxID=2763260 RepID=UPI001CFF97F4|nr:YdeI/OmpD-associated family protein [Oceaniglobus trochenteri]